MDQARAAEELELIPGAAAALCALRAAGYRLCVVTNQSAVARGIITEDDLARVHGSLERDLAAGGAELDGIFYCPHHPSEGSAPYRTDCDCRKPLPGLLERAASELGLDLARSWIVGDALRDLDAGHAVGVRGILVATGKGTTERARLAERGDAAELIEAFAPDLGAAADRILAAAPRR